MHAPHKTIEYTQVEILFSALECQVSLGDTNGEVANHKCNLAYGTK